MKQSVENKFTQVWTVTGLFLSALVGAGFATGREIFTYFVRYGIWGFVGFVCACVCLGCCAFWMFAGRATLQPYRKLITLFTFCAYITMVAGFRDVLKLLFPEVAAHYPFLYGLCACGIVTAFSLFVLYKGFQFFAALGKVIPPFVLFNMLFVCGVYLYQNGVSFAPSGQREDLCRIWISTILYVGYNVLFLAGVVLRSGTIKFDRKIHTKGSIVGTALFMLCGVSIYGVLLYQPLAVAQSSMPLYLLVQKWGVIPGNLFGLLLAFTMLFSAASAFCAAAGGGRKVRFTGKILALLAIPVSYMGFNAFLSVVYPLFGVAGIFLFITLAQTHRKNV